MMIRKHAHALQHNQSDLFTDMLYAITQKQNFHFLFAKNFRAKDFAFVQNMLAAHMTAVAL